VVKYDLRYSCYSSFFFKKIKGGGVFKKSESKKKFSFKDFSESILLSKNTTEGFICYQVCYQYALPYTSKIRIRKKQEIMVLL